MKYKEIVHASMEMPYVVAKRFLKVLLLLIEIDHVAPTTKQFHKMDLY